MGTRTDQRDRKNPNQTDREATHAGKVVLGFLGGIGILAALVMSLVALLHSTGAEYAGAAHATVMQSAPATTGASTQPSSAPTTHSDSAAPLKVVNLSVVPEGKRASDGKLHDYFTVTEFRVKVGQPVTLHIDNTDSSPHTITSPEAGVNIIVRPGTHDYTLLVNKAGTFRWNCMLPCDNWAMSHVGYMAGRITAS